MLLMQLMLQNILSSPPLPSRSGNSPLIIVMPQTTTKISKTSPRQQYCPLENQLTSKNNFPPSFPKCPLGGDIISFSSVQWLSREWLLWPQGLQPGFPVHHQLLEFTQTHVHRVDDAIQPSHPLSSPSPIFNLSQHQGLFQWIGSSHQVATVLEFQLQHQSF